MTEIKIVFPLSCHSADALRTLQSLISDFTLSWEFDDLPPCIFRTEIVEHVSIPLRNHYDRNCPAVVFRSIVALSTESDSDIVSLDKDSEAYFFCDEFCFYEVREVVMTLALALVIAHPEIHFGQLPFYTYLNEKCYDHDCCTKNPLHHDAYKYHAAIITSSITLQSTFDWVKCKTKNLRKLNKPGNSLSALSYILNRDIRESLIYSSIGLEGIFVPENRNERKRLISRINLFFPNISSAETVDMMYTLRSKFVHGEFSMGIYSLMEQPLDQKDSEVEKVTLFVIAIFIESIRRLILNDASSIKFSDGTSYSYQA